MMSRKWIIALFLASVIGIGEGYLFRNLYRILDCYAGDVVKISGFCSDAYWEFGVAFTPAMTALAVVFLVLAIFPKTFPAWKKFAVWAIPIVFFIFIMEPESNSGGLGGGVGFGPTSIEVYQWGSVAFAVVSLIITAIAALRKQR